MTEDYDDAVSTGINLNTIAGNVFLWYEVWYED